MPEFSISPTGERFASPCKEDYAAEYRRLQELAVAARDDGKEIVVVMALGFVGGCDGSHHWRHGSIRRAVTRPNLSLGANGLAPAATGRRPF
jgi:hypothetical protein